MSTQSKNLKPEAHVSGVSDWLREWRKFSGPMIEKSKANPI